MLNNREGFTNQEIEVLSILPELRDQIFFPAYEGYGYVAEDCSITIVNSALSIFKLQLGLISTIAKRKLSLGYVFKRGESLEKGVITDAIYDLNKTEGWDIRIDMEVLIKKRTKKAVPHNYNRLDKYDGSFREQIIACFKKIKVYYDDCASDIISGQNWDPNAHDNSYI